MDNYLMICSVFLRWSDKIKTTYPIYTANEIPKKQLNNARAKYAFDADPNTVIGLYDTTLLGSGKEGYLFTDEAMYVKINMYPPFVVPYRRIAALALRDGKKDSDKERLLDITMQDGTVFTVNSIFINKTPLCGFLREAAECLDPGKFAAAPEPEPEPQPAKSYGYTIIEPEPEPQPAQSYGYTIIEPEPEPEPQPAKSYGYTIIEPEPEPQPTREEALHSARMEHFANIAELFGRCSADLFTGYGMLYPPDNIPKSALKTAKASFARDLDCDRVIGFFDITIRKSGKEGVIITDEAIYIKDSFASPLRIPYGEIKSMRLSDKESSDSKRHLFIDVGNDFTYDIGMINLNKTTLYRFLSDAKSLAKCHAENAAKYADPSKNGFQDNMYRILYRYADWICTSGRKYVCDQITTSLFKGARDKYAHNAKQEFCYFLADTSLLRSGATGILVTLWGVYSYASLESKIAVYFGDIESFDVENKALKIVLKNGTRLTVDNTNLNADALAKMLNEILAFYKDYCEHVESYTPEQEIPYRMLLRSMNERFDDKPDNWLELQRQYGNPYAEMETADRIRLGKGRPANAEKARKLYCRIHHPAAYRKVAQMYFEGAFAGVEPEEAHKKAEEYFIKARALGDLESAIGIANMYFLGINHKADYKKAYSVYRSLADTVEHEKLPKELYCNLGMCLCFGYGCEQNSVEAEYWLKPVRDVNPFSKFLLGSIYLDEPRHASERAEGLKYIRESAREDCVDAMIRLAEIDCEGELCAQNFAEARSLLTRAAATGNALAQYRFGVFCISPFNDSPDPERGFAEIKKAADQGLAEAMRDLALCYQYGIGVRRDIAKARESFAKAAGAGDAFSGEWKDQARLFLNRLRLINTTCVVNETGDESSFDDMYLDDVKEDLKYDPLTQRQVDVASIVSSYPIVMAAQNRAVIGADKFLTRNRRLKQAFTAASISTSNVETVGSTMFFRNFAQVRGEGPAMEYAAHINDRLRFKNARWIGADNQTNGADRIINESKIQSKCYDPGSKSFKNRLMNELAPKNEQGVRQARYPGQKIELNSDALNELKKHPNEYRELVDLYGEDGLKDSGFTNKQCINMTKFGTIDSLKIDAKQGIIAGRQAFALSMTLHMAVSLLSGYDKKEAVKYSLAQAAKSFGQAFTISMLSTQLMRVSSINHLPVAQKLASQSMQNIFSRATGQSIHTVTAAQNFVRANIVSAGISTLVLSSVDIVRLIRGRISKEQLLKNVTVTAATVAAGTVGSIIGGAICGVISPTMAKVGMFAGAAIASSLVGSVAQTTLDCFIENDGDRMLEIFNGVFAVMAEEYLLAEDEINYVIDEVMARKILSDKGLRDLYAADDRDGFCRDKLTPVIDEVCGLRGFVVLPSDEEFAETVEELAGEPA